jgi:hypothetical protein
VDQQIIYDQAAIPLVEANCKKIHSAFAQSYIRLPPVDCRFTVNEGCEIKPRRWGALGMGY